VSNPVPEALTKPASPEEAARETTVVAVEAPRISYVRVAAIPVAALLAQLFHHVVSEKELPAPTQLFAKFLWIVVGVGGAVAALQFVWHGFRRWLNELAPIFAAGVLLLGFWEAVTVWLALLPLPYFPGPPAVALSLVNDWELLWDSTWHSLLLLLEGYLIGVAAGLISGVCIGWFRFARYWGMPILKVIGPIPATAWIPLAMVVFARTPSLSAAILIALAVWFPVTMLTASGISNTRASYLDVARTLGASRTYLIFRVAIPAAMPNIFIGLFMGLGASFLTLVVAEKVGVKSGLGWYIDWAQGYAEYGKVYAALIIMAVFFSTVMTALFKIRDRILVWQKGVIKW